MTTPKTKTTDPKTTDPKTTDPKTTDTANAKRINDALAKLASADYVRKGCKVEELEALAKIVPFLAKLDGIDAAGGAKIDAVVCVKRHSAVSGWQTLAAFPCNVHSSKVAPAGNVPASVDATWYVPASAADFKAAAAGNGKRVHNVTIDGKVISLKGNATTGQPVKAKLNLRKYFNEYVGAAMRDALFEALPAASVNHETDTTIKARHWMVELTPTKQVSVKA